MILKPLSVQARKDALEKAAQARARRAEAKRKVKTGQWTVTEVVRWAAKDEALGRMKVSELLEAFPGIGSVRAQKLMKRFGIAPNRRIRGLGVLQLQKLAEWEKTERS